jgi:hypothetical protein
VIRRLFIAAALLLLACASHVSAQPSCINSNENLMSWPTNNPVWQFCWVRPTGSSGANGSGLEIRQAYYNGHLVLKRGHVPILNVKYDPGGCGGTGLCYRDWLTTEHSYLSNNPISTGYAEPTCPPVTVCEDPTGIDACDINPPPPGCTRECFQGVSAEKLPDRLILTSQNEAGWYRYTMKWIFYLDGRIQPRFGFTAVADPCTNFTHRHHAYWRLDFDIDGPDGNVVTEGPNPSALPGRPGPKPPSVVISTEAMRRNNRPDLTWTIVDSATKRGYRIVPGDETELPADTFSVGDVWLLNYNANEIDDTGQGPGCAAKISNFVNGESLANDLVLWYRTGALHAGGDLDHCHVVGPTLVPVGDWSP